MAVERVGLPPLTPHDLRKTAAGLAVAAVKALQRVLGVGLGGVALERVDHQREPGCIG
jgi:integrase